MLVVHDTMDLHHYYLPVWAHFWFRYFARGSISCGIIYYTVLFYTTVAIAVYFLCKETAFLHALLLSILLDSRLTHTDIPCTVVLHSLPPNNNSVAVSARLDTVRHCHFRSSGCVCGDIFVISDTHAFIITFIITVVFTRLVICDSGVRDFRHTRLHHYFLHYRSIY